MADIIKTQHFTKQYERILKNIKFYPEKAIDPFAGECDLKNYSPNTNWTFYDIEPKNEYVLKNDSLLNPIDYTDKTIITNPPYLAKNKTSEFDEIFKKYNVDDLYKASILSLIGCKNGILIIPINFFTDENSKDIRNIFLSQYKVTYVNVFENQVFENTTYNVCSFYFEKGKTSEVVFYNVDSNKSTNIILSKDFDYRLGGEFYNSFKDIKPVFSRITENNKNNSTDLFLTALDKRKEKINISFNKKHYIGKKSDRIFATLSCKFILSEEEQLELANKFNSYLNTEREKYNNLILTNYRDFGRKRISFEDVYKICTMILYDMK